MLNEDAEKERYKLEKYLRRNGQSDLIEKLNRAGADELKAKMQQQALYRQEIISSRQNDQGLKIARETARALASPYGENLRACDKISRLVSLILEDQGK